MTKKIAPPERSTTAAETSRTIVDALISAIPWVGGPIATIGRRVAPSKSDTKTQEWHSEVSDTLNDHTDGIDRQGRQLKNIGASVEDLQTGVSALDKQVGQIATGASSRDVAIDSYDGALEACRKLVEKRKYQTAFELLDNRLSGPAETAPSDALRAAIVTLQGVCQLHLGEEVRAASLFLQAFALDSNAIKVRANTVVGHLIEKRFDDAVEVLDGLLAEEPGEPIHWANFIHAKGAAGASLDYLDDVPAQLRSAERVMLATVDVLRARDDHTWRDRARETLSAHPSSQTARRYAAEAELEDAVALVRSSSPKPEDVSAARSRASAAACELADLWITLLETEIPARRTHIDLLHNAITGYRLAEEVDEALELAKGSIDELMADERCRTTLAALALDARRGDLLKRVFEYSFKNKAVIQLEWAAQNRDWREALRIVETCPEELASEDELSPENLTEILYIMNGPETKKAENFASLLTEDLEAPSCLFLSKIARSVGIFDVADKALRRAIDMEAPKNRAFRLRLASEAAQHDWPEDVIELLRGEIDLAHDISPRRWMAIAYARSTRPLQSGISFFRALRPHAAGDADLQRAGGHFELARRQPRDAAPWFRRAIAIEPGNALTILALWQALAQSGQTRAAERLLDEVDLDDLNGAGSDQLDLAQLLWRRGRVEALDFAYELASRHQDDPAVCLSYFGLLLIDTMKADAPPIPPVTHVEKGAWVSLSRANGDPFSFVVADEADVTRDHLALENEIVAAALGKTVGDTFRTEMGPNEFLWKIEELKPRALHLFHRLSNGFQDRFPEQRSFFVLKMGDDDLEPVFRTVRRQSAHSDGLASTYKKSGLPLGAIATASGKTVLELAHSFSASGWRIHTATGLVGERETERALLGETNGRGLVLDSLTAWTLANLGHLSDIQAAGFKLVIPGSAVDELRALAEELGEKTGPILTLTAKGEDIFRTEHTAGEIEDARAEILDVIGDIERSTVTVGTEMPDGRIEASRQLPDLLGVQFDTVSVAVRDNAVVLSSDLGLRRVSREICGHDAIGLGPLLDHLLEAGVVGADRHATALTSLACQGHSVLTVTPALLFHAYENDETPGAVRFEALARQLGIENAEPTSHIDVASAFADLAFAFLPTLRAQAGTSIVLRALIRMKSVTVGAILNRFSRTSRDPRVSAYIEPWARGHFLLQTIEDKRSVSEALPHHPQSEEDPRS